VSDECWKPIRDESGALQIVEKLRLSFDVRKPLHEDSSAIGAMAEVSKALAAETGTAFRLLEIALVFHYIDLLRDGGAKFELDSLTFDLVELLVVAGARTAGSVAGLIGQSAPDVMVTTLLYSRWPERYTSLRHRPVPMKFDVPELAIAELQRREAVAARVHQTPTASRLGTSAQDVLPDEGIVQQAPDESEAEPPVAKIKVTDLISPGEQEGLAPTDPVLVHHMEGGILSGEPSIEPVDLAESANSASRASDSQVALQFEGQQPSADDSKIVAPKKRRRSSSPPPSPLPSSD